MSKYFIYQVEEYNNGYSLSHAVIARSESEAVAVSLCEKANITKVVEVGLSHIKKTGRLASESL